MVPNIDHDLDVDGDVILTLENPNEPFAVWADEVDPWERLRSPPPVLGDHLAERFRQLDPACLYKPEADEFQPQGWGGFQEGDPPREPADAPERSETEQLDTDPPERVQLKQAGPEEDDDVISNGTSPVRFRLSSRHLISASPYFKAMLTGPWEENASRAHSLRTVSATGWDENALKLLMDIIHGNSQNIPRSIDLDLLAKVAVLVDYYKCYDVVKFYSDTWIGGLGGFIEYPPYSRNTVLVLFVSCVFFQPGTFQDMTHQAMLETQGPLQLLDLPFPGGLIGLWPIMPVC